MKLFTLSAVIGAMLLSHESGAQSYPLFGTSEDIDIANIKAAHLVHGDMWWDPATGTPRCEFPKGSGKHLGFGTHIWMGGTDNLGALKTSALFYRTGNGTTDFWPGPIDAAATTPVMKYASCQPWAKIWKISSSQINAFLNTAPHTVNNTPAAILEWPAKGNPYARGAGGAALIITGDMAPFVDMNSNGQYDPLAGDYPKIKGQQMLWWIINDNGPSHNFTASSALNMDIRVSAYAYARGTSADNIIFYEYELTNRSAATLNNFRFGIHTDSDLGYAFDDYIGFDSSRRMGVIYNSMVVDGVGQSTDYGVNPPMMGVTLLEAPDDVPAGYAPAGSFGFIPANNLTAQSIYNSLKMSYPDSRYGFSLATECEEKNQAGDRRFILAANQFSFAPGATKKFAVALLACAAAGGCPDMDFTCIQSTADTAWSLYWKRSETTSVPGISKGGSLRIYPNPASDMLFIETPDQAAGDLRLYDALGRLVAPMQIRQQEKISLHTSSLPNGVYTLKYVSAGLTLTSKFIKE